MVYVSQLQLAENTIIRRSRQLVFPGQVQVQVGQAVMPDTILAKTELLPAMPIVIDLASYLQVEPAQVPLLLQRQVGEQVEIGDILAVSENSLLQGGRRVYASPCKGMIEHVSASRGLLFLREATAEDEPMVTVNAAKELGVRSRFLRTFCHVREGDEVALGSMLASSDGYGADAVRSPIRGTVVKIDTKSGTIHLAKPYSPSYAKAYLAGRVQEIIPERGAVVETTGTFLQGVFGIGGEQYGRLMRIEEAQPVVLDAHHFHEQLAGCVVFGGSGITLAGMRAAVANQVAGVIVGGLRSAHIVELLGQEISLAITGQEDIATSFIATEGFGHLPMLDLTYELLCRHVGCMTSINGRTQIRAGVQRPEIIISHPIQGSPPVSPTASPHLSIGSRVRAIVDPYFGQMGEVMEMLPAQMLPTEVCMPLVRVRLQSGQTVDLLPNNVESIRS